MKQVLKKQIAVILTMVMMLSFGVGNINSKAAAEDLIQLTNITQTSAEFNWSNMVASYAAQGKNIVNFKVTISAGETKQVMEEATLATAYIIYNMAPGTSYLLEVEPNFYYTGDTSATSSGYEYLFFTTLPYDVPVTAVTAPSITKVTMSDTKVGIEANSVSADGYEYRICNKKNDAVVDSEEGYSTSKVFYNIPSNKTYYAQVRAFVYDSSYNKVYSEWSDKAYVISQPVIKVKASKTNAHSINFKWKKVTGAKNYTVYGRKKGASKWSKIKTVKGTSYTITKIKGTKLNCYSKNYEVTVVANTKIGGKKYTSSKSHYMYTYHYVSYN